MSNLQILKGVKDAIWIKVTARVRQDESKVIEVPFRIRCKVPTSTQTKEIAAKAEGGTLYDDEVTEEFLTDWEMPGSDGNPVEFNDDNIAVAMDHPDYRKAIMDGILELFFGKEFLQAKNSLSSGVRGPRRR